MSHDIRKAIGLFFLLFIINYSFVIAVEIDGIDRGKEELLSLCGQWEFYPDTLLYPGELSRGINKTFLPVPSRFSAHDSLSSELGKGTYRYVFQTTESRNHLMLPRINTGSVVFINGEKVKEWGTWSGKSLQSIDFGVSTYKLAVNQEIELVIWVTGNDFLNVGIPFAPYLGSKLSIERQSRWLFWLNHTLCGLLFCVTFIFLSFYFFVKKLKPFAWLALASFIVGLMMFLSEGAWMEWLNVSLFYPFLSRLELFLTEIVLFPFVGFFVSFLPRFFPRKSVKIFYALAICYFIINFFLPAEIYVPILDYAHLVSLLSLVYILVGVFRAVYKGVRGAWWILSGVFLGFVAAVYDVIQYFLEFHSPVGSLAPYGAIVFFFFLLTAVREQYRDRGDSFKPVGDRSFLPRFITYVSTIFVLLSNQYHHLSFEFYQWFFTMVVFAWPHIARVRYTHSGKRMGVELQNFKIDSFFCGLVISLVFFNPWVTVTFLVIISAQNFAIGGFKGAIQNLMYQSLGMLLGLLLTGGHFSTDTSLMVQVFSFFTVYVYLLLFTRANNQATERLRHAKTQIKHKNDNLELANSEILNKSEELNALIEEVTATNDQLEEAFEELNVKNQNILSSIGYAKRIQSSMLPSQEELRNSFPDYFVLFKPRDIVSGDFFWHSRSTPEPVFADVLTEDGPQRIFKGFSNEKHIIAAVDCTGHGVPGALMAMTGDTLLSQIVNVQKVYDSARILSALDEEVRKLLKQDAASSTNSDGMDMALCVVDYTLKEIQFSGAKNSFFCVYPDGEIISSFEIKGDKFPIGSTQYGVDKKFSRHKIPIKEGMKMYLYSDGFQDQFGGPKKKKFLPKKFKKLLIDTYDFSMIDQRDYLEKTLHNWMDEGMEDQVDDVLVLGISF